LDQEELHRFNRRSPSDFAHSKDLACGEVGTPEVPKARVNRGHPKSEDTCQEIMYSGGITLQKEVRSGGLPKSRRPRVHMGHPLERTHIEILEDLKDKYSRRIEGRGVDLDH
jgi:hypothetical protein